MINISKNKKIAIAAVSILAGIYAVARFGFSSNVVPKDFNDARMNGALISQNIVDISSQIGEDINKVNKFDKEKKYKDALVLTKSLIGRSRNVRAKAVELSQQLEKMTKSLASIKQTEARGAALEAIANYLTIINKLINYSDYLSQMLSTLQAKFEGLPSDKNISTLVYQINAEVKAINNFNKQASIAMERFDSIVKNK